MSRSRSRMISLAQQDKERISPDRSAPGKQKAAGLLDALKDSLRFQGQSDSALSPLHYVPLRLALSCRVLHTALTYPDDDTLSNLLLFLSSSLYSVQVHRSLLLKLIGNWS